MAFAANDARGMARNLIAGNSEETEKGELREPCPARFLKTRKIDTMFRVAE